MRLSTIASVVVASLLAFLTIASAAKAVPVQLQPLGLFNLQDPTGTVQAGMAHSGASRLRGGNVLEIQFGTTTVTPATAWSFLSLEVVILSDQATPTDAAGNPIAQFANLFVYSDASATTLLQQITLPLDLEPRNSRTPTLFTVSLPAPQIASFAINRTGSTAISVDNWLYQQAPIPEPSTALLMMGGLYGLAAGTRRR